MKEATTSGCLVPFHPPRDAPPETTPHPAGPQGAGTAFHSKSLTFLVKLLTCHEPDCIIAHVPSINLGIAFLYFAPADPGHPSSGIKPSLCQSTNNLAAFLNPSSTNINLPSSPTNLAP